MISPKKSVEYLSETPETHNKGVNWFNFFEWAVRFHSLDDLHGSLPVSLEYVNALFDTGYLDSQDDKFV